jgi:Cys-tRNA(Pro)/Cys-tRNA(Cys) deacylase
MDHYAKKLQDYIEQKDVGAELLFFAESCHSVTEAARSAGASEDQLVKNICLQGPEQELAVAIVRGGDRVCTKKVAKLLGLSKMRMATPEEILANTGFPCGGTPSFGYQAHFIIDQRVPAMPLVYTGGGSVNALVKATPQAILAANSGEVADIIKE